MRTENFKHGVVSILLVSALVFSMVTIAAPLASAGGWPGNPHPGGDTIEVAQGGTFIITHELLWDEAGVDGWYTITLGWDCYDNKPEENLTFISASATFTSGSYSGQSILAQASIMSSQSGANTRHALIVKCPATAMDSRDGDFNVDIVMGAYGAGGVPHIPTDDHPTLQQLGGVIVTESMMDSWNRDPTHIKVIAAGVDVDISPASQEDWTGATLDYTVTVTNLGARADNYTLVLTDTADPDWTMNIVPSSFTNLAPGSSDTATLTVTVGAGTDTITVTADGVYADGENTCTATQTEGLNVDVSISEPKWQEGLPGSKLYYEVVITNTGTENDNYDVTIDDALSWGSHFSTATIYPTDDACPNDFGMPIDGETLIDCWGYVGAEIVTYFRFDLAAEPALAGATIENATLHLFAMEDEVFDVLHKIGEVSDDSWTEETITTANQPALGSEITGILFGTNSYQWVEADVTSYIVSEFGGDGIASLWVHPDPSLALGNTKSKEANHPITSPYLEVTYSTLLYTPPPVLPGESITKTLTVPIPLDAVPGTTNDITVTATSQSDNTISSSDTCEAYVTPAKEVDVEPIVPSSQEECPNKTLSYSVTVTNVGEEADSYNVVLSDDLGWDPLWDATGSNTIPLSLGVSESATLPFGVVVPANATPDQVDTITVTATSTTEPEVTDSESAVAEVKPLRIVEIVSIEPDWDETYKDPLTYVVRIRNAGQLADKYNLTATSPLGWPVRMEPQEIYLEPGREAQAALSVTIPYDTLGGTEDTITVDVDGNLASGTFTDPVNSSASGSCIAHAKEVWKVDLEVYPSIHQTGHPDSELTWLVTVTNTGNVPDTYDLTLSQDVYDAVRSYDAWGPGLAVSQVTLDPGEEASILLNLLVPGDLRTGVHNDITVEVTGVASDIAYVTAQVLEQKPRIPQGEIELQAVAGIVAIDVWPTYYDFGVLNEMEEATSTEIFTVRNVGNVDVEVSIAGTDAVSKPGEPAAKWTLADGFVGVDTYALWRTGDITVTKEAKLLGSLVPSDETSFDLRVQAPSTFTTPAKMWMKVLLTARQI